MGKSKCVDLGKNILSKLPVFIFCVLFISVYNKIFGNENSIIGVVILVGVLMFLKVNLGFNTKQASISIVLLFIIIALCPKLSLINPFVGIIINFISIGIIMVISSYNVSMDDSLTFMLGYIFSQGYDIGGELYSKRVVSLLIGSFIIAGIYYLMNSKKKNDKSLSDIFKELDIKSHKTQWYLKVAATLTLTMFLGDFFNFPKTMWINLTVLSLITPLNEEHKLRRKYRVPASTLGTILFFILFEKLIPLEYQSIAIMSAGFLSMFITSYFIKTMYNSFSALSTAVLLFTTTEAIAIRIISNVIGVIISICCYKLFDKLFNKILLECDENLSCV